MLVIEFNGVKQRIRKHFWKDPYELKGQEKAECLTDLIDFVEWFRGLKNPSFNLKELYFSALEKLDSEARRRQIYYHNLANKYAKEIHQMQTEELNRYQGQLKGDFLTKLIRNNNKMTPELQREWADLTKMEQASCYVIHGLQVMKRECRSCGHQTCKYAEARKENAE